MVKDSEFVLALMDCVRATVKGLTFRITHLVVAII